MVVTWHLCKHQNVLHYQHGLYYVQAMGLEDLIKEHTCLGCSNLQWRNEIRSRVPVLTATELSSFSSNPKESHLKSALAKLQAKIQVCVNYKYFSFCSVAIEYSPLFICSKTRRHL